MTNGTDEAATPKTTTLPRRVWTPWAEVLCRKCGLEAAEGVDHSIDPELVVTVPDDDRHVGKCDRCGTAIGDDDREIIALSNLARRIGGEMEQTGGMCAAAVVRLADERSVAITAEGTDGTFLICVYPPGMWESGTLPDDAQSLSFEEDDLEAAVARVEALKTAGKA